MNRWALLFALLLSAAIVHAGGITSFEPDSAQVRRDREPMVETPIWLGSSWTVSSLYRPGGDGLVRGPVSFSGFGFGATWPWKSRRQSYVEWHYGVRNVLHEYPTWIYVGGSLVPGTYIYTEHLDLFALRTGVEQRFGRRPTPWCTAGGGIGYAFNASDLPALAFELTGRATVFAYPTAHTRVGLMLSAGPAWVGRGTGLTSNFRDGGERSGPRTHFDVTLRFESRLRFPRAVADAEK
jgi:hypothetical protein